MSMKILSTLTLFLALALPNPFSAFALEKGEPLPEVQGTTLEGEAFDLSSFKDGPILLKIGTTWCDACRTQYQEISNLGGYLKENGIRFVEVFIQEKKKTVRKYFSKGEGLLPDAVVLDNGDIHKALNVYLIPRVILIDKNYRVYRDGSVLSEDELKQKLTAMLAES
jgi:thiol-disulfide isomerase/thioredoxin